MKHKLIYTHTNTYNQIKNVKILMPLLTKKRNQLKTFLVLNLEYLIIEAKTKGYSPKTMRVIYTANWIGSFNKEFHRTFKIRNSMPNFESALTLLSKIAMDKEETYFKYRFIILNLTKLNASNLISQR